MNYTDFCQIELYIDDIEEIISQVLVYMNNPEDINDSIELYFSALSVLEILDTIKIILRKEVWSKMKIILNHKVKVKMAEEAINYLSLVKSYLEVKKIQEYIDLEDVIIQLKLSIEISHRLYKELKYLYERLYTKQWKEKL